MVKQALSLIASICFAAISFSAPERDETNWSGAAQDSTGLVWGITEEGPLFTTSGSGWETVGFYWAENRRLDTPKTITRAPGGSVLILWNESSSGAESDQYAVTQHCGRESRVLGAFSAKLDRPVLFPDSRGNLWITDAGGDIYRFKPGEPIEHLYHIGPDQSRAGRDRHYVTKDYFNPLQPIEGGEGAIWFWSDGRSWDVMDLTTLLAYRDGKFICPTAPGLPQMADCTYALREDASNVLLVFRKQGLFRLNLQTLNASPVLSCDPDNVQVIKDVMQVNGQTYISAWGRLAGPALWHLRQPNEASKVAELPEHPDDPLSVLPLESGAVFGTNASGLVFVAAGQNESQTYNARNNFPLPGATHLFPITNKGILVVSKHGSAMAPFPPWDQPPPNSTFELVDAGAPLKDKSDHLWAGSANGAAIKEWNGESWTVYPLPPHKELIGPLQLDNHGRIWVNGYERVFIFDPTTHQWNIENGMHPALEHALAADRHFTLSENGAWHGAFSGDGRVSFRDDAGHVILEYYDGKRWRKWTSWPISNGLPTFDQSGVLRAQNRDSRWHFDGENWVADASVPEATPAPITPSTPQVSINGQAYAFESLQKDGSGCAWLTVDRQLYRARPGLPLPVFAANEAHPFIDGRLVQSVVSDAKGNVFLTTTNPHECLMFRKTSPGPATRLDVEARDDWVRAKMDAEPAGRHWFTWRIDNKPWSAPTDQREVTLSYLSNGFHVFAAKAFDEHLDIDKKTATAFFTVAVDRPKQVETAMRELNSADFPTREKAVRTLVRQPRLALPALQEARQKASDDIRWWIDAAIQEIQRSTATTPHK